MQKNIAQIRVHKRRPIQLYKTFSEDECNLYALTIKRSPLLSVIFCIASWPY